MLGYAAAGDAAASIRIATAAALAMRPDVARARGRKQADTVSSSPACWTRAEQASAGRFVDTGVIVVRTFSNADLINIIL
jgi:hypothetical protein